MLTRRRPWPGLQWGRRLYLRLRAMYLQVLLDSCLSDIEHHRYTAEVTPLLIRLAEQHRDELRLAIMDCELEARTK